MSMEMDRIINRHIARLLTELESAECPAALRDIVKRKMQWLRHDLQIERMKLPIDGGGNE